jgi:hypothetical protein
LHVDSKEAIYMKIAKGMNADENEFSILENKIYHLI